MDIIILGYGKMGRMIENEALARGHRVVARVDAKEDWTKVDDLNLKGASGVVAIDFSIPEAVMGNIDECFARRIPIVVGTTGWYKEMEQVKARCIGEKQSFFWASNFSIGVYLFDKLNVQLARLMKDFSDYSPRMREIHHVHKKDAPSGTAITLAEHLLEQYPAKKRWMLGESSESDTLSIEAVRQGEECGTHIIDYESEVDEIEIRHSAKSRRGFAIGALRAAEWLQGRKGFFTMSDMLG